MKTSSKILLVVTLLMALPAMMHAAGVDGRWKAEFEVQDSQMKYVYEFKADGEKLTGKCFRDRDGEKATNAVQEGKIKGDEISFVELVHNEGQDDLRIEYSGKVNGDEIKFARKVGDFGSNEVVAKREKEEAPAAITGKWQSEFDSQVGHQKYTYEFKLDGDKVTGKATREVEDQKTTTDITGKLTGNEITFSEPLKLPDQDQALQIDYTGKIAGDEIKLTRKVGDIATTEIVAKRVKE